MNALKLTSPQGKLVMWYKCKELFEKGFTKAQICRTKHLDKKTVRHYLRMRCEEFINSQSYKRMYLKKLDPYEDIIRGWLEQHSDLSSSQIHDWLRERYNNLPRVNPKMVYNFVQFIRAKYEILKPSKQSVRQYCQVEETEYGEYAQADFGEMWMQYSDGSRKKYVFFSLTPFTAALSVYAHEKAFEYYGGKPHKIIYDQDAVLIHDENLGDYLLTKAFQSFVNQAIILRKNSVMELEVIRNKIYEIRGQRVMLDKDFMFQLSKEECSRFQFGTLNTLRGYNIKYLPYAFTEMGVAMLSSVLRSNTAISVNRNIMRAFVTMRNYISFVSTASAELADKQKTMEDYKSRNKIGFK